MTTVYFGPRWDAPFLDDDFGDEPPRQVPTPVDVPCLWCTEPIQAHEPGLLRASYRRVDGEMQGTVEPIHAECDLRMGMGGLAHVTGRCSCRGFPEPDYPGTARAEALAVVAVLDEKRASQGLSPFMVRPEVPTQPTTDVSEASWTDIVSDDDVSRSI